MWSCKDCHHIYHFPCAKEWALKRRDCFKFRTWRWPCPTCKRLQIGGEDAMSPACWCGRWRHHHVDVIGNSCGRRCTGYKTCDSPGAKCERFCQKLCHPGPCEQVVCVPTCALVRFPHFKTGKKKVENVYQTPQPPPRARVLPHGPVPPRRPLPNTYHARMQREAPVRESAAQPAREPIPDVELEFETLKEGETGAAVLGLVLLAALETGMWYWVKYHTNRWTRPLQYKNFTENTRGIEAAVGIAFGCVILTLFKTLFAASAFYLAGKCLVHYLHLPRSGGGRLIVALLCTLATLACCVDFPIA